MVNRLLHSVFSRAIVPLGAGVINAVADDLPVIVFSDAQNVQLVAAARAMPMSPQRSRSRVDCRALQVAMPEAPDFFEVVRRFGVRIISR